LIKIIPDFQILSDDTLSNGLLETNQDTNQASEGSDGMKPTAGTVW